MPVAVDRARELRIADEVADGRANEEVRLAYDLAFLAVEIDDGAEAPLGDGGGSLGKEATRFPFSLAPIRDRREVRHVGRGGQRFEMPGLVLLAQPSERRLERAGAGFRDAVSAKVDAKPAPGGQVVVEDVRRDEADQEEGGRFFAGRESLRRTSRAESPPVVFQAARDRAIIRRKLRFELRERVSKSALVTRTSAATGSPLTVKTTGPF